MLLSSLSILVGTWYKLGHIRSHAVLKVSYQQFSRASHEAVCQPGLLQSTTIVSADCHLYVWVLGHAHGECVHHYASVSLWHCSPHMNIDFFSDIRPVCECNKTLLKAGDCKGLPRKE